MKRVTLIILLACLVTFNMPAFGQEPDPGVVYEVSDYAAHGVPYGINWTGDGAEFDGINDYIALNCDSLIAAGFNVDHFFVMVEQQAHADITGDGSPNYIWTVYTGSTRASLYEVGSGSSEIGFQRDGDVPPSVETSHSSDTNWHITTGYQDVTGDDQHSWFDGADEQSVAGLSTISGSLTNCVIGVYGNLTAWFWQGTIRNLILSLDVIPDASGRAALHSAALTQTITASLLDDVFGADHWLWWPMCPVDDFVSQGVFDYFTLSSGQLAATRYEVTAGDYVVGLLLFAACLLLLALVSIEILNLRRTR